MLVRTVILVLLVKHAGSVGNVLLLISDIHDIIILVKQVILVLLVKQSF